MESAAPGGEGARIRVFMSYSRQDMDFAEAVVGRLSAAGVESWVDHEKLKGGDRWTDAIDNAIREADALVLILTPRAIESDYVLYEWAFAAGRGVPIVPILRERVDVHPRLQTMQWIDFSDSAARPWDALVDVVRARAEERGRTLRDAERQARLKRAPHDLEADDVRLVEATAAWLAELADPRADAILVDAMEKRARVSVVLAAAERRLVAAVPHLIDACGYGDSPSASNAQTGLLEIAAPETVDLVAARLRHDFAQLQLHENLLGVLGSWRDVGRALPIVVDYLERVRLLPNSRSTSGLESVPKDNIVAAVRALGSLGHASAVEPLVALLEHPSRRVVEVAIEALARIGAPESVEPLLGRLRASESDIVLAAMCALGRFDDQRAARALVEIAAGRAATSVGAPAHARAAAVEALAGMAGLGAGALREVVESGDLEARAAVADLVCRTHGPDSLVPVLIPLLDDARVVRYEFTSVGRASPYEAEAPLSDLVASALVAIGSDAALDALKRRRSAP